mgnify:CR=1 FL=1
MEYKISELVAKTGVPKSTILYYIREGLLPEAKKIKSNVHRYSDEHIELIHYIKYMKEIIVIDQPVVKITYINDLSTITVVWNSKPNNEKYINTFKKVLEFLEKSSDTVQNFVSDITNQGIMGPEIRKLFEAEVLPNAIKLRIKRGAVIFDGNVFKKYYLNLILKVANIYKVPFKFFNSEEEVFNWFKSFQ